MNNSPGTYLGGSWTRIQDVFPYFGYTKHVPGVTGGEETHVLTESEMPPHSHVEQMYFEGYTTENGIRGLGYKDGSSDGGNKYFTSQMPHKGSQSSVSTKEAGSGQSHNNMPPYQSFYAWRRVA